VAGLLHDIGKIEVSGEILRKAAELSSEEKKLLDDQTLKGAYILFSVGSVLKEVVPIVLSHHKYFIRPVKGSDGRLGTLPLGARIIGVADAFDAMTTDHPYRKAKPLWEALGEIVNNTGKQFDPEVVEAFKRVINQRIEEV
jgi:HD-GYP domain-containing protein (c-di-GMP phosphodiesterase class II)